MEIVQMLVGSMDVYAYLLGCPESKKAAVIDPGGAAGKIKAEADKRGYEIIYILNTHNHPDHTAANAELKDLTGAKILIHKDDAHHLSSPSMASAAISMGCQPSPPADKTLDDNELISLGQDCQIKVVHTPGHTPGGVCFYNEGNIFTGDTLFVGAVGRTDLSGGSWPVMLNSLKNRVLTFPEDTVVWPGHHYGPTPQSTVGREKRTNPFVQ
jgi:glyoxylase-like metal-dependent hydrolase (beta-lactamase superfamily II)